jgi:hypothetical protein
MPGAGSLVAGRISGYAQFALAVGGMVLTLLFGGRFILWYFANWDRFHAGDTDPMEAFREMWVVLRWAALGFALFILSWLWALATSLQILLAAKEGNSAEVPPRLS